MGSASPSGGAFAGEDEGGPHHRVGEFGRALKVKHRRFGALKCPGLRHQFAQNCLNESNQTKGEYIANGMRGLDCRNRPIELFPYIFDGLHKISSKSCFANCTKSEGGQGDTQLAGGYETIGIIKGCLNEFCRFIALFRQLIDSGTPDACQCHLGRDEKDVYTYEDWDQYKLVNS